MPSKRSSSRSTSRRRKRLEMPRRRSRSAPKNSTITSRKPRRGSSTRNSSAPAPPPDRKTPSRSVKRRFEYIDPQYIDNMRTYHSASQDWSLLSNYVFKHFWNEVVELFPMTVAPNVITISGFLIGMSGPLVALYFKTASLNGETPDWVWLLCAISLFVYQTFDAVDGKQARRTKTSSPLGEFLDHGLDAMITQFVMLSVCLCINAPPWMVCLVLLQSAISLFTCIWEQFTTGVFTLGILSGPTEGIVICILQHLATFFLSQDMWNSTPFGVWNVDIPPRILSRILTTFEIEKSGASSVITMGSLRSLYFLFLSLSWIFTVGSNFVNVAKGATRLKVAHYILIPMAAPLLLHLCLYARFPSIHNAWVPCFELSLGTLVAISCAKMCVSRLTSSQYNPFHVYYFLFVFSHLAVLLFPTPHSTNVEEQRIGVLMIVLCVTGFLFYAHFMFSVVYQVKQYFKISVFTIHSR